MNLHNKVQFLFNQSNFVKLTLSLHGKRVYELLEDFGQAFLKPNQQSITNGIYKWLIKWSKVNLKIRWPEHQMHLYIFTN